MVKAGSNVLHFRFGIDATKCHQWLSKVKLPLGDWSGESRENTMGVYGTQNMLSNLLNTINQKFKYNRRNI